MEQELRNLNLRREIVAAYIVAIEHREDLFRLVEGAPDDIDATTRVISEAFGVSDIAARAIQDLQVRRFTPQSIAQMREELVALDQHLARLHNS
jgi:DNA gyrase/topoisomerase IV subunit A